MTDADFAAAFEAGLIPPDQFNHRQHLRVAWACLLGTPDVHAASERMAGLLRRFTAAVGQPQKYHETLTQFWVRLLAELRERSGDVQFVVLIAHNPGILDKDFVLRFYPREALFSDKARQEWIAPPLLSPARHAAEAHSRAAAGDAWRRPVPGAA
jgi:hypothetical protein